MAVNLATPNPAELLPAIYGARGLVDIETVVDLLAGEVPPDRVGSSPLNS